MADATGCEHELLNHMPYWFHTAKGALLCYSWTSDAYAHLTLTQDQQVCLIGDFRPFLTFLPKLMHCMAHCCVACTSLTRVCSTSGAADNSVCAVCCAQLALALRDLKTVHGLATDDGIDIDDQFVEAFPFEWSQSWAGGIAFFFPGQVRRLSILIQDS